METKPKLAAGRNIAMKVPPHLFEATVKFYREILQLNELSTPAPSVGFEFGSNELWIDPVAGMSQAEIWLEIVTNDLEAAATLLAEAGVVRCDEIEPLPQGFQAFWISSPASIVHLVCKDTEEGKKAVF